MIILQSQEEYFFYKPILGMRRLSNKSPELNMNGRDLGRSHASKKDANNSQNKDSTHNHMFNSSINQNHLCSPK